MPNLATPVQAGSVFDSIMVIITTYGLSVLGAIGILVVGWMVSNWISRMVVNGLARTGRIDQTLRDFLGSLVRYALLVFTGLAVLNQFGIQTASVIAVLGALGLAIGLALQGTLSHVAAGVMLLMFRPFKIGDNIEAAGLAGQVREIGLFATELVTPDRVQIIIPNAQIWDKPVKNFTRYGAEPSTPTP
jgi:small conductance mechanosensitive channel